MGNQAHQQSRELELWQVVSTPKNAGARARSDKRKRGTVTSYSRPETARTRHAGTGRTSRTGRSEGTRYAGEMRGSSRAGAARPAQAQRRASRQAQQIQTIYPGAARSGSSRGRAVRVDMPGAGQYYAYQDYAYQKPRRQGTKRAGAQPQGRRAAAQASKRQKAGRRARSGQFLALLWVAAMSIAIIYMGKNIYQSAVRDTATKEKNAAVKPVQDEELPVVEDRERKPEIVEDFLTVSEYNRPGTTLAQVKNIFVHYTANPGTSAAQNRSYFENLGQTHERAASAHFIIGYEGEIIQCIPLDEEAYAVVERNGDSISIECCYLDKNGAFTQETYDSLVEMLAWLTDKYDLEPGDILRHYDCGGKLCPVYYVEHEDAWQKLLSDVEHFTL